MLDMRPIRNVIICYLYNNILCIILCITIRFKYYFTYFIEQPQLLSCLQTPLKISHANYKKKKKKIVYHNIINI